MNGPLPPTAVVAVIGAGAMGAGVAQIAAQAGHRVRLLAPPGRVAGMHFFNPAPVTALVEVVSGLATEPDVAATVHATALAWGKSPVHARSTPSFIVNRCARPFYAEALRLMTEGAGDPATFDAVMRESGGFKMGPSKLMDLIGHDVNFSVARSVFDAFFGDPKFTPSLVQQEMVSAGFFGCKSGRGFYDHAADAVRPMAATESPAALTSPVELWVGEPLGQILATRLKTASVPFASHDAAHEDGRFLRVGDARIYVTDGRSATQRAADNGQPDTVLVDLTLDAACATRFAATRGDRCSDAAFVDAVAVLQAAGLQVSSLADVPGLLVMHSVAMLANEAADALR